MHDERQQEPHASIPYEKSRARRMARKLGLRVICAGKKNGPAASSEARDDGKQQQYQTRADRTPREEMLEERAG